MLAATAGMMIALPALAHHVEGNVRCVDGDTVINYPGVKVNVEGGGFIGSGLTDANGDYYISLPSGLYTTYAISIVTTDGAIPPGVTPVDPPDGETTFVTTSTDNRKTVNFILTGCAEPEPASIGDRVWYDLNCDGIQDEGEPGAEGVVVSLLDCQGNVLAQTVTDAAGFYLFTDLMPGDYNIQFTLLAGFSFSPQDQGADDALDSDADPQTGATICTALESGEVDLTWDAGLCETQEPGIGCRTTGGGKLLREHTDPRLEANFVTFGGQVGASLGVGTPWEPDSEFIRGQWQHVRHGSQDAKANFHASSFDSLMCACFEEGSTPGVVVGEICNPGDRVNGPEPRRAPANKICFSGVGKISLGNGPRIFPALFRVDIEDRSEPGGNGKPSEAPADRYRIRIWVLPEDANPNDDDLMDVRMAIACWPISVLTTDGAPGPLGSAVFGVDPAPTIDDGGILDFGNRQIHPPTGATLKLF